MSTIGAQAIFQVCGQIASATSAATAAALSPACASWNASVTAT